MFIYTLSVFLCFLNNYVLILNEVNKLLPSLYFQVPKKTSHYQNCLVPLGKMKMMKMIYL
jgi:hypothetical protein